MSAELESGHVEYPPGVRLVVINCKHWRLKDMKPACLDGRDLQCSSCEARMPRDEPLSVGAIFAVSEAQAPPSPPEPVPEPPRRLRGLGDVVAAVTTAVGIRPCEGCKRRQEGLNRAVPFGPPSTVDKTP